MQVQSTRSPAWFYVDWWLHNHCSWHCSYCPDILKSGSLPWPRYIDCCVFIDQIRARSNQIKIKFTGGEPTEWSSFEDLLSYAGQQGIELSLRTNANLDSVRWARIVDLLDSVEMNFHPEHAQISVYLLNLDRSVAANLDVRCVFNMLPARFEETESLITKIKQKYPQVLIERRMLFEDPAVNTQPMNYSEPQQQQIIRQFGDIKVTDNDRVFYTDYPTMVAEGTNMFKGFSCSAGIEQIVVDAWGRVLRGHCRQGSSLGSLGGELRWPNEAVICNRPDCSNAFDILATKIKI